MLHSESFSQSFLKSCASCRALKRVRAAHVHAIAHKFLADHSSQELSEQHLRSAIAALKPSSTSAARYMSDLSGSQGKAPPELESLADLYVDTLLLLLDCADRLGASSGDAEERSRLGKLSEGVLKELGIQ